MSRFFLSISYINDNWGHSIKLAQHESLRVSRLRRNPTSLRLCTSLRDKKPFTVRGNFTKVTLTYIALT